MGRLHVSGVLIRRLRMNRLFVGRLFVSWLFVLRPGAVGVLLRWLAGAGLLELFRLLRVAAGRRQLFGVLRVRFGWRTYFRILLPRVDAGSLRYFLARGVRCVTARSLRRIVALRVGPGLRHFRSPLVANSFASLNPGP